jgi:adenine-specific DNA-methyltransferase
MPSLDPRPNQRYYITCPDNTKVITPSEDKMFRWIPATFQKNLKDDRVVFLKTKTSPLIDERGNKAAWNIYTKTYLHERQETGMKPLTFIDIPNSLGSKELIKMGIDFSFSKPKELIKYLISITDKESDITVLDFFAGSGTTGQAVLELNNEDSGRRKFILCTNNENNICADICYPRVKNVISGYKSAKGEAVTGLNGNLKYFKTDFVGSDSNDKNKRDLVNKSTEMICIKEDIFDLVVDEGFDFKIYQKDKKFLGVVFDIDSLDAFKAAAEKCKGSFSVYCFSYNETTPEKEFKNLNNEYTFKPIPAIILKVYLEIFKK